MFAVRCVLRTSQGWSRSRGRLLGCLGSLLGCYFAEKSPFATLGPCWPPGSSGNALAWSYVAAGGAEQRVDRPSQALVRHAEQSGARSARRDAAHG